MPFTAVNKEYINNKKEYKEKNVFNDSRKEMHLRLWDSYLVGISNNPSLTKKEVCEKMGLKIGTIDSIKKLYKLESPFRFNLRGKKKPKSSEPVDIGFVPIAEPKVLGHPPTPGKIRNNKKGAYEAPHDYDKDIEEMGASL